MDRIDLEKQHRAFINRAIVLAEKAEQAGEVPVGALLVKDDQIIAEGWNQSISHNDPSAHAEIQVLRAAGQSQSNYRLPGTTLYVTLEPCSMCAGALIHARVSHLVFGAYDTKAGAVCSVHHLLESNPRQHRVQWTGGILEQECSQQISRFFKQRRLGSMKNPNP